MFLQGDCLLHYYLLLGSPFICAFYLCLFAILLIYIYIYFFLSLASVSIISRSFYVCFLLQCSNDWSFFAYFFPIEIAPKPLLCLTRFIGITASLTVSKNDLFLNLSFQWYKATVSIFFYLLMLVCIKWMYRMFVHWLLHLCISNKKKKDNNLV